MQARLEIPSSADDVWARVAGQLDRVWVVRSLRSPRYSSQFDRNGSVPSEKNVVGRRSRSSPLP